MSTSSALFSWPVRVYYEDTDLQGVVYYANYFRFMERARTEWLRSFGMDQDELRRDQRRMFVVAGVEAHFRSPARFNDQLVVTAEVLNRARASFVLRQEIYRGSLDGELLCAGTVRAACIDADTYKPARIPESLFKELSS